MADCMYHLCVLYTLLSGIYASWIVHSESATWRLAAESCIADNQILVNRFDEQMIQNLTSCFNKEDLTFWTGGFTGVSLTDWIAFFGCFYVRNQGDIFRNESQSHTVSSCYQLCGRDMFGLTINSCVCFGNEILSFPTFQKTNECILGKEEIFGINGSMAIYKFGNFSRLRTKETSRQWCAYDICNKYSYYRSRDCRFNTKYKCDNGFTSDEELTWNEAMNACYNNGSFLQGPTPDRRCGTPGMKYWSYVRRFREHNYLSPDSYWSSDIIECEIANLNGGSMTLERTADCDNKRLQLPYVCQLDDGLNYIYIESLSERCNQEKDTTQFTYTSTTEYTTILPTGSNCIPQESKTTINLETGTTTSMKIKIIIVAGSLSGIVAVAVVVFVIIASRRYTKKKNSKKIEHVYTVPAITSTPKSVYKSLQQNDNSDATAARGTVDSREMSFNLTTSSQAYEYMN